jgi:uncharacterized protein YbaP (TraB family)
MHRITALFIGVIFSTIFGAFFNFQVAFAQAESAVKTEAVKPAAPSAKKNTIPLRGVLYRVDYRGHTCYLFGTVHVGQAAFYPLEPQVTRALTKADKLVIEVDIRNTALLQQAVVRHGFYADGQTLDTQLSTEDLAKLKEALRRLGIPYENVARMKPWMMANLLIIQEMARNGFATQDGIEMYFLSIAKRQKKAVGELETIDYQLSLFDQLSRQQQQDYLRETLQDLSDGDIVKKSTALIDAWSRADSAAIYKLSQEMAGGDSASSQLIEKMLLDRRNPGMATKIEALVKNDNATFVAVGALHLIGDNSVPALLKQRGYQVTKLY